MKWQNGQVGLNIMFSILHAKWICTEKEVPSVVKAFSIQGAFTIMRP